MYEIASLPMVARNDGRKGVARNDRRKVILAMKERIGYAQGWRNGIDSDGGGVPTIS
jgi:hypothetical protein